MIFKVTYILVLLEEHCSVYNKLALKKNQYPTAQEFLIKTTIFNCKLISRPTRNILLQWSIEDIILNKSSTSILDLKWFKREQRRHKPLPSLAKEIRENYYNLCTKIPFWKSYHLSLILFSRFLKAPSMLSSKGLKFYRICIWFISLYIKAANTKK